jgi:hypothetical protein
MTAATLALKLVLAGQSHGWLTIWNRPWLPVPPMRKSLAWQFRAVRSSAKDGNGPSGSPLSPLPVLFRKVAAAVPSAAAARNVRRLMLEPRAARSSSTLPSGSGGAAAVSSILRLGPRVPACHQDPLHGSLSLLRVSDLRPCELHHRVGLAVSGETLAVSLLSSSNAFESCSASRPQPRSGLALTGCVRHTGCGAARPRPADEQRCLTLLCSTDAGNRRGGAWFMRRSR